MNHPNHERRSTPVVIASGLSSLSGGTSRLTNVSFAVGGREMLAVIGGSGAGKSTLIRGLSGTEPVTAGSILINGRDLYRDFSEVRHLIGYVPQDDILHSVLTVDTTLRYAALLRMPSATDEQRRDRIDDVLTQLGLDARRSARIDQLSGGQRKRVNVAVELLARPQVLILDEPTSGLDPANERALMETLRRLADASGRAVIVVTHSTDSLHLCDRVLFLGEGGRCLYHGPPNRLPAAFGATSYVEAFAKVADGSAPQASTAIVDRKQPPPPTGPDPAAPPPPTPVAHNETRSRFTQWAADSEQVGREFSILARRYIDVIRGDARNLGILAAQGPLLGFVMLIVFGSGKLDPTGVSGAEAASLLLAVVLSVVFIGAASAVREIVKEADIFQREQTLGISTAAYVGSKAAVLGTVAMTHSVTVLLLSLIRHGGPDEGLLGFGWGLEALVVVALSALGAVGLGLFISAIVTTSDKAMTILPLVLFLQLLLAGVIVPISGFGIGQLSFFVSSRWGLSGLGSIVDLWRLRGCDVGAATNCMSSWQHDAGNLVAALLMLTVLLAATLYGTYWSLQRRNPEVNLGRWVDR